MIVDALAVPGIRPGRSVENSGAQALLNIMRGERRATR
jgi:hypothetical protein